MYGERKIRKQKMEKVEIGRWDKRKRNEYGRSV